MRLHQRIRREQARNTDDWLITYADTITLLLCLIVIILSIKTSEKNLTRDAAPAVTQVTAPGDIFWGQSALHSAVPITEPATGDKPPDSHDDLAEPSPEPLPLTAIAAEPAAPPAPMAHAAAPEVEGPAIARAVSPSIVDRMGAQGTAIIEQRGDRITTLQISSTAFFASGSAALSGAGKSILGDVAVTLKSAEFAAYHITVEGHTDDAPISTVQFQSNWELSAARAAAVVRFFLEQNIPAAKLTAAGYADTFPIAPNRNADGSVIPDNQARNRRVVIKLERIDKSER
jgi:chemotaxis protein MotB